LKKQATVWVFLRGLIRESGHWGTFPEQFQKAFPDHHILTIDLPGNGIQHLNDSPTSMSDYARFAHGELQKALFDLKDEGPYQINLLAISLGGMVAIEWNRLYPGIFKRAVLMNTSIKGVSPMTQRLRAKNYPKILNLILNPWVKNIEAQILELVCNDLKKRAVTAVAWNKIRDERPVSTANSIRQIRAALGFRPDISSLNIATLLLGSEKDNLVSCQCSKDLHKTVPSQLELHPWAGHDLGLDDPDWVIEKVQNWLLKQDKELEKTTTSSNVSREKPANSSL
jgi:pimeloyl-ACP methyl ester carboxylesterase